MKAESENGELNLTNISKILSSGYLPVKSKPVTLGRQFLAQHFNPDQRAEEIEKIIAVALEQYFSNRKLKTERLAKTKYLEMSKL